MKQLRNIIDVWNMIEKFNLQGWVVTVSYTHLDVYKRQAPAIILCTDIVSAASV